VQKYCLAQN